MTPKEAYKAAYRAIRIEERLAATCPDGNFRVLRYDKAYLHANHSWMMNQRHFSGWRNFIRQMDFNLKRFPRFTRKQVAA